MIYYFSLGLGFIVLLALSAITVYTIGCKVDKRYGGKNKDFNLFVRFFVLSFIAAALILLITALGYGVHLTYFGGVNETLRGNK